MDLTAKKTPKQREDEETERLVRPSPKVKPPRRDLRRERVDAEKDPDAEDPSAKKDLSRNYKVIGGAMIRRLVRRATKERIPARSRETGDVVNILPSTLKEQPDKYEAIDPGESESPSADSEDPRERYQRAGDALRALARENKRLHNMLRSVVTPGEYYHGWAKENPDFSVDQIFRKMEIALPEGIQTLKDLQMAASTPPSKPFKKPKKEPNPSIGSKPSEKKPEPTEEPKPEEALSDEGVPEPTANEKIGIPAPQRREVSAVERQAAAALLANTFSPEVAADLLASNIHPDDVRTLIRRYLKAVSEVKIKDPSDFASKVAVVFQTDPSKVAPPTVWKGQILEAMSLEEKAEATRQHQLQRVALSLAARKALTDKLSSKGALSGKPRIPPHLAAKLAGVMLAGTPDDQGNKAADELFNETLENGKSERITDGAVKELLSKVRNNPVARKMARAYFQAVDFKRAKENFLDSGDISEWDSPRGIARGLNKASKFFAARSNLYGEGYTTHPSYTLFKMRVLSRLRSLKPESYRVVQSYVYRAEEDEYRTQYRKWKSAHRAWKDRLRAHQASGKSPEEFKEEEPLEPAKPVTILENEDSGWDEVLQKKASTFTYPASFVMGKTGVYHGIDPYAFPVSYPGWLQPHQRDLGESDYRDILAGAKKWLSSPLLSVAVEGMVPDARFRAALDLAIYAGPYNRAIDPKVYNELLARLSGGVEPGRGETLLTKQGSNQTSSFRSTRSDSSKEIRRIAAQVVHSNPRMAMDLLAVAERNEQP